MYRSTSSLLRYGTLTLLTFCLPLQLHAEISQTERNSTYQQLETFANVLSILQENYVDEIQNRAYGAFGFSMNLGNGYYVFSQVQLLLYDYL